MHASPLIGYTLAGLNRCFMPDRGLWSSRYHLDGRAEVNDARPGDDVFASLTVLLGMSRLSDEALAEAGVEPRAMLPDVAARLLDTETPRGAYGMALWAAAELAVPVPGAVLDRLLAMSADRSAVRRWGAQDVGLLLSGAVAQSRTDPAWTRLARTARDVILDDLLGPGALFRDRASGLQRFFGCFATQVHCVLALYQSSARFGDPRAALVADRCVERLVDLQGSRGEWPRLYEVKRGRVLDVYDIRSVHQLGMAPAILIHAMRRGVPGARAALSKGFQWALGRNALSRTMLHSELPLIARAQARRGGVGVRSLRLARRALSMVSSREPRLDLGRETPTITPEARSQELGWILWAFGDDTEFPELTHDRSFGTGDRVSFVPAASRIGEAWARAPEPVSPMDAASLQMS